MIAYIITYITGLLSGIIIMMIVVRLLRNYTLEQKRARKSQQLKHVKKNSLPSIEPEEKACNVIYLSGYYSK